MTHEHETRHLPLPDVETEAYWDAAAEGRLVFRRCRTCQTAYHYPRARCRDCRSDDVVWETAGGSGTIHSFTVVRQNHARPFRDRLPYVVALIDLDEGPRVLTNVDTDAPDELRIGQAVRVAFRDEGELSLPVVVPET